MDTPQPMEQPSVQVYSPAPPPRSHGWVTAVAIIGLLVALGAGGYWWYLQHPSSTGPTASESPSASVTPVAGTHVRWQTPEKVLGLSYVPVYPDMEDVAQLPQYTKVGTFTDGPYKDSDLLLVIGMQQGPGWPPAYRFARTAQGPVLLERHSDAFWSEEDFKRPFTTDKTYVIPDLDLPEYLDSPWDDIALQKQGVFGFFGYRFWNELDESRLVKAFDSPYGPVWTDKVPQAATPTPGMDVPYRPEFYGFYIKGPDSSVFTYAPKVGFLAEGFPKVRWNEGNSSTEYVTFRVTGCGQGSYLDVIPPFEISPARDLKETGRTEDGDPIYEFKDSNHAILKETYETMNAGASTPKMSYANFLQLHPIFFWTDPLGRLVKFQSKDVLPGVECGKPVIYLYPPTTQWVSVKVEPKGGMTVSDPAYGDGWFVQAQPDGRLFSPAAGSEYPYLFWEGRGGLYEQPKRGWSVAQSDVSEFLSDKLGALGLNATEIADFKEFWLPRMQDAPYYFVTFLGNQAMDELAPLTVRPQPDTVIRVLMDFSPLSGPADVKPFTILTPKRTGFTVVEWGGVIR